MSKSVALRILRRAGFDQTNAMNWKTIRLELAGTREFPAGSVGRAFLLRLPLQEDGWISEDEIAKNPSRATVRRFWASDPDRTGHIVRSEGSWALIDGMDGAPSYRLPSQPIRLGELVIMTTPDGSELPFRVAGMRQLG